MGMTTEVLPELSRALASGIPRRIYEPLLQSVSPRGTEAVVLVGFSEDLDDAVSLSYYDGERWDEVQLSEGVFGVWVFGDRPDDWVAVRHGLVEPGVATVTGHFNGRSESFPTSEGRYFVAFWPGPGEAVDEREPVEVSGALPDRWWR